MYLNHLKGQFKVRAFYGTVERCLTFLHASKKSKNVGFLEVLRTKTVTHFGSAHVHKPLTPLFSGTILVPI